METILTKDDLQAVVQDLSFAANKWRDIGAKLGLNELELNSIKSNQHLDCLRDVIFKWLYLSDGWPPEMGITRRRASLIEALRSPSVGEMQLADRLTKKYTSLFPPRVATSEFSCLVYMYSTHTPSIIL